MPYIYKLFSKIIFVLTCSMHVRGCSLMLIRSTYYLHLAVSGNVWTNIFYLLREQNPDREQNPVITCDNQLAPCFPNVLPWSSMYSIISRITGFNYCFPFKFFLSFFFCVYSRVWIICKWFYICCSGSCSLCKNW